ncbi:cobalamin-binding protein [Paraneptunicella aestuarii]|uniref:cobalamin-binding protein n=1 Tax=Paraneptunicella aestuarii TaxID=2831148 RepID=UPI001E3FD1EE|nr:cobalamin-binding protein [Paraneptunicella aestuarii]UAA37755.1 cobalamin-binding protein [Paraneptunicella aestuarii]
MLSVRYWQSILLACCLCILSAHAADKELFRKEQVEKPTIIALAPHIVEVLFEVGAGEQIIAATEYSDYPEQAKDIPVIGNYLGLQIERIIELNPDLIIAWQGGNPATDLDKLKKLGFEILYSFPLELTDVPKEMRLYGAKTHNAESAERVASAFEQRLSAMKKQYQDQKWQTAFYEIWHQPLTTVAKPGWAHNLLETCHIRNAFADAGNPYPQVNIEQVLEENIELIIQPVSISQGQTSGYQWSQWPDIPAVKNHRIIQPDSDKLHRMSSRVLDELQWLCEQATK